MPDNLRPQAGPWCGGLTDTSVVIRASVMRSVKTARVIVAGRRPPVDHCWDDHDWPYSLGNEHGQLGPGIAGNRQFGVFEIDYRSGPEPRVIWTALRAEQETAAVTELLRHEFPARQTLPGFLMA